LPERTAWLWYIRGSLSAQPGSQNPTRSYEELKSPVGLCPQGTRRPTWGRNIRFVIVERQWNAAHDDLSDLSPFHFVIYFIPAGETAKDIRARGTTNGSGRLECPSDDDASSPFCRPPSGSDGMRTRMIKMEDGEVVVTLRQSVKRSGELMATYELEYPNLAAAFEEIGDDLKAGRVERLVVDGHELSRDDIEILITAE
jgi:hypothetical protein